MTDSEALVAALPVWSGTPKIRPLLGGLSNLSFAVDDRTGRYVVRLGGDVSVHDVVREREIAVARAAHAAGFAPEVVYAAPGVMVSRFIDGQVYTSAHVRRGMDRVADLLRRFHGGLAGLANRGGPFSVFAVNRRYGDVLRDSRNPLTIRLAELLAVNERLGAAQPPAPPVFAHHDLLPANLIDDGSRLWLIDFEYAGPGAAMFDLGGLASNAGFSPAESEALLALYLGRRPTGTERRSHAGMACASLLREALWALVSELHLSAPGADYAGYARQSLSRFDAALARYEDAEAVGG